MRVAIVIIKRNGVGGTCAVYQLATDCLAYRSSYRHAGLYMCLSHSVEMKWCIYDRHNRRENILVNHWIKADTL